MPPGTAAHAKSEAKKAAFVALIVEGASKSQALAEISVPMNTYASWRRKDDDFRARVDAATGGKLRSRPVDRKWAGSIIEGRKTFFGFDSYYHHVKIIQAIEETPPMGITLVLLPPEHGKSTVIADWISLKIGQVPNIRVAYVSEGLGLARKAARRQKMRMTVISAANAAYLARFGPFHEEGSDKPWTADYFVVDKSDHDEQDYTFEARGWKSAIAGSRVDVLVIDDIQSRKSLNATGEMLETFRQDFVSRVGKEGRIIVIGTRVGEEDVYQGLIDQGIVSRIVMLPATEVGVEVACPLVERRYNELLDGRDEADFTQDERVDLKLLAQKACGGDEGPPAFRDGSPIPHERPLCPEMWDAHQLAVRRGQVDEVAWWRNYQQNPRKAGDLTFTEQMMDDAKDLFRVKGERTLFGPTLHLAGLDPSLTGGNAFVVADGNFQSLQILDCVMKFGMARTEAILEQIDSYWKMHRFTDLVIEVNAFQKALGNDARLVNLARLRGFRTHPHTTGLNKLDETFGVAAMATSFAVGEIRIPYGDQHTRDIVTPLINQLLNWRPLVATKKIRQDLVMALWFAWLRWMNRRKGLLELEGVDLTITGRPGSPFFTPPPPPGRGPVPRHGSPFYTPQPIGARR